MKYHVGIKISIAKELLKDGTNIFNNTPKEALEALQEQEAQGKEFFTGCDNESLEGKCLGHEE